MKGETMLKCLGAAALLCCVVVASVQSADYRVLGYGTLSCGRWVTDRKANGWPATVELAWVEGFITAADHVTPKINQATRATDVAGIATWIDNYCATNPLNSISRASEALASTLASRN